MQNDDIKCSLMEGTYEINNNDVIAYLPDDKGSLLFKNFVKKGADYDVTVNGNVDLNDYKFKTIPTGFFAPLVISHYLNKQYSLAGIPGFYQNEEFKWIFSKINGIYIPYWLFNCDSSCSARYRATRVSSFVSGNYEITNTDHYLVYRDGTMSFSNIPVDASLKLSPELLESLEPFDFKDGVDFNTAYLAGYFADKYEEDKDVTIKRANERIKQTTEEMMHSTVLGYVSVIQESSNIRIKEGKIKYALLPIYVFNTTYKGKQFTFAMNGQTGKISGNLPSDNKKFALILSITFIVVFVLMFLLMRLVIK